MNSIDFTSLLFDLEAEEPVDIPVDKKTFKQCRKPYRILHAVEIIKGDRKRDAMIVAMQDCKLKVDGKSIHEYRVRLEFNGLIHSV